jgi:GH25 family lysozyme M1 (1,4-beta-N-acetylmuramidase)
VRVVLRLAAVALVAALLSLAPASPAGAAKTTLPGIDVSNWQGTIDWSTVAATGVRFAVIKATEGRTYDDPYYAANLKGATANGIVAGAYHFARPDSSDGDPGAEADHFVSVADPTPGEIVPVLDLEQAGHLSVTNLQDWTKRWLARVTSLTGVRPMIYSSPSFWTEHMGDTTWFANHGYDLYWIANWGVTTPATPANDWGGHGWTIWQWTSCQHVKGISGCVDGDRFRGTDLRTIQIPRLDVTATGGGGVTSDVGGISCPGTCSTITDPSTTVTLSADPGPGAGLLSWGGACSGAGAANTCQVTTLGKKRATATFGYRLRVSTSGVGTGLVTSKPAGISCGATCTDLIPVGATVTLTATPDAASEFAGWSGACTGDAPTCTVTMNAAHRASAAFADLAPPTATIQPPTTLIGPVRVAFSEPVHGVDAATVTLRVEGTGTALSSSLRCVDGTGARVDCAGGDVERATLTPTSPLLLGQRYAAVVDPASATSPIVDRAGNPLATTASAFRAATTIGQTGPGTSFRWGSVTDDRALGGSYLVDHRAGASLGFAFRGSRVSWYTATGPAMGRARVLVDGRAVGTVDGYAPGFHARVARTFGGLSAGSHILRIVVLGTHDAAATGSRVVVDGFATATTTVKSPSPPARWAGVHDPRASGGSFAVADVAGASASLVFRGSGLALTTVTGPAMGRAAVFVDGVRVRVLDLSAATTTVGVMRTLTGLTDAVHHVRVVVLGRPGASGTGTGIAVDGWAAS